MKVENVFARLKPFKVLQGLLPYHWQRLSDIVRALAVGHNLNPRKRGAHEGRLELCSNYETAFLYKPGKLTGHGLLVMTSPSSQGKLVTVHGTVTGRMLSSAPQFEELPRRSFSSSLTPRQRAVLGMLVDGKLTIDGDSGPRTFTKDELLGIFSGQQLPRDAKVCSFLGLPDPNADFSSLERRLMSIGE